MRSASGRLDQNVVRELFGFKVDDIKPKQLTMVLAEASANLEADGHYPELQNAIASEQKRHGIVTRYFSHTHYGYNHGLAVSKRALELVFYSPGIKEFCQDVYHFTDAQMQSLLTWAAVFHDMGKFAGHPRHHEEPGSNIISFAFQQLGPEVSKALQQMVEHHDFFCAIVDGCSMPPILRTFPLAEVLRLADRTSITPEEEVNRWWLYGRKAGTPLLDGSLPNEVRFTFDRKKARVDQLTFFLMLFAIQRRDFFFTDNAESFSQWAKGRGSALSRIADIFAEEGCSAKELQAMYRIVHEFHEHKKFEMPDRRNRVA